MENFEQEHQVPKSLLERLQAEKPDGNVAFTAIEQLKDEAQIREFFEQYVELLKGEIEDDPEAMARQNISFMVGYYDKETADRWEKALPGVSHPVSGKDIPRSDTKRAYEVDHEEEK